MRRGRSKTAGFAPSSRRRLPTFSINNCFKNGILPIVLDAAVVDRLFRECEANEGYAPDGRSGQADRHHAHRRSALSFEVDAGRKHRLLNGLDDIGLTCCRPTRSRRMKRGARSKRRGCLPDYYPRGASRRRNALLIASRLCGKRFKNMKIAVLPGDGIGPEIVAQAVKVLDVLQVRTARKSKWKPRPSAAQATTRRAIRCRRRR